MNLSLGSTSFSCKPSRMAWIRFNRVLAWSMIVAPLLELLLQISLPISLLFDFVVLLLHGILSLILFGWPKVKGKQFTFSLHIMGFRHSDMTPRNRFLLSGYRVLLPLVAVLVAFVPFGFGLVFLLLAFYPVLRWGISMIQHIYLGMSYAVQRWRQWPGYAAWMVTVYICLWLFNVFK